MWRNLVKVVRELRRSYGEASASYRPDLHYMRGPGPKWHEKHGGMAPSLAPIALGTAAARRRTPERQS